MRTFKAHITSTDRLRIVIEPLHHQHRSCTTATQQCNETPAPARTSKLARPRTTHTVEWGMKRDSFRRVAVFWGRAAACADRLSE